MYVHDRKVHNVAVFRSYRCEIANVEAARSHDKNISIFVAGIVRAMNNYCHDSHGEDGSSCLRPAGTNMLVANNLAKGNSRLGIGVGHASDYSTIVRNIATSNSVNNAIVGVAPFEEKKNHHKADSKGLIVIDNSVNENKGR